MIIETRKCDGCGEKIEPVDGESLSNVSAERRAQLISSKRMFTRVTLGLQADALWPVGRNPEEHGKLTVDVCATCAETRTIASFKIPPPQV